MQLLLLPQEGYVSMTEGCKQYKQSEWQAKCLCAVLSGRKGGLKDLSLLPKGLKVLFQDTTSKVYKNWTVFQNLLKQTIFPLQAKNNRH